MESRPPELDAQTLAKLHRRQEHAIQEAMAVSAPALENVGIVMVAGGGQAFTNAWVALTNLRCVQRTQLPIQLWHLGPDELSPVMRVAIRRFDIELVDAYEVCRRHPMRRLGPWECKAYATLHSPFRHVVLLDADNVPLVDPARLIDTGEYARTGAIFWPDNHSHLAQSPVWDLFDVPYRDELEVESGQLVVDKERCWVPLKLAVHYNAWSDIYYRYVYGDKETFRFAWHRVEHLFARPQGRPRPVYCLRETPYGQRRMTAALEQADFAGNVVFHHRTGAKWMLDGDNPSSLSPELDAICFGALAELRTLWDGRITQDPLPPRDGEQQGADGSLFRLRRIGVEERTVRLDPNGRVKGGDERARWWRLDGGGIILGNRQGATCCLDRCGAGVWRGRERWYERGMTELVLLG